MAESETRFRTKLVRSEVPDGVTLHLTNDESKALVAVLHRVGGHPDKSWRRYTDEIAGALHTQGYFPHEVMSEIDDESPHVQGRSSIYFANVHDFTELQDDDDDEDDYEDDYFYDDRGND
jgi:hypothetical protein